MEEASATLRELGVEPWLAEASAKRLLDTARSLAGRFSEAPPSYREVIEALKTEER